MKFKFPFFVYCGNQVLVLANSNLRFVEHSSLICSERTKFLFQRIEVFIDRKNQLCVSEHSSLHRKKQVCFSENSSLYRKNQVGVNRCELSR